MPIVGRSDPNLFFDNFLDPAALHQAHRRLVSCHSKIIASHFVPETRRGEAQISQKLHSLRQVRVVGDNHSAFAGGDNFVSVKAETAQVAETSSHSSSAGGAMRFGAIFD